MGLTPSVNRCVVRSTEERDGGGVPRPCLTVNDSEDPGLNRIGKPFVCLRGQ